MQQILVYVVYVTQECTFHNHSLALFAFIFLLLYATFVLVCRLFCHPPSSYLSSIFIVYHSRSRPFYLFADLSARYSGSNMASTQHDQFKLLPGYDNVVTANGDYLVTTSSQPILGSTLLELNVTNEEHYEVLERSSDGEYLRVRRRYNKAKAIREGWAPINLFTHLVYIHQDEPLQLQAGYVNKVIAT